MTLNGLESDQSSLDLGFLEFKLFGPLNALFRSSLMYAAEYDMGIQISNGVLRCDLPDEINVLLGLELINDGSLMSQGNLHLLRFAPLSPEKLAHTSLQQYRLWQRVFHEQMPDAVLSFDVNRVHDELHWGINDSWLVWDWKLSTLERIELSKQANDRLDIIHSDPDWFTFTKQAVHKHPMVLAEQLIKREAMPAKVIEELERYDNGSTKH